MKNSLIPVTLTVVLIVAFILGIAGMAFAQSLQSDAASEEVSGAVSGSVLGSYKYYVAGSYAKKDSPSFLYVFNPGEQEATFSITLHYEKSVGEPRNRIVKAKSLVKIELKEYDKSESPFSIELVSDRPLVVQHLQFDAANSAGWGEMAVDKPAKLWEFGEGYSTGSAKTILYLYNPADTVARATVTTYRDDGGRKVFDLDLPRKRLVRYDMKEQIYSQNRYGIKVVSKTPIVVGASNFNKLFSGGSGGHGAVRAKEWNFAGGYVSEQATDFLNLVNPTLDNAHINVTIYYEGGETTGFDVQVEQLMKKHVMLNNHVKQKSPYSLAVISDQPIVAEMTHYDEEYSGGWGLLGEQEGAKEWLFAAGIPADDNHLAIFNPGPGDAGVTVKLYYPGEIVREFYEQLGTGRSTIQMDTLAEQGMEYGIQVISDKKIFVQQVLYERKYDAGAAMYGVKGVEQVKETAEELEVADEGLEQVTGAAIEVEESGLALLSREPVAPERLGVIAEGMDSAMKSIYDDEGNKVIAWSFDYDNQGDAMNALQNILSSALMKVMEYSPGSIKDVEVYSLTAENSAGYAWQSGNKVRVVLANDQVDAMKVAEVMVSPTSGPGFWTTRNILILLAVVIIVLWFVLRGKKKRQEELDEDFDDWDNAYEDTEEPDEKKAVSSKKTVAPVKRPVKEEKKETKTAKKEEMKKQEVKKEVVKKEETRKEERKERKIRHEEDKPEVKIERIDQPQQGVQEFEVVDYEDLFKHRNRDGDEIKPQ